MKKLALTTVLLLLAVSAVYADDDSATKQDAMLKHCRSMMKDGKMMDGMPKQMTDKCQALMKNDDMEDMNKDAMPSDTAKPATPDTNLEHHQTHPND
ncbi:MAG: hypothetical protein WCD70_06810 [Alphaproteobacteria bacterium]